ncbi:MAG: hypothetical protein H5U40_06405, partial [Polyangiaceae bacterium]|nr:hypothetical protein [Polyangiaceae bacterium]
MSTEESRRADTVSPDPADPRFEEAAQAVRDDAADDGAWDALEAYAGEHQQPEPVSRLYTEVLALSLEPDVAASLGQRAIAFHEEWYGEDSPALLGVLRRILEVDPTASDWAFSRLTVTYTSSERWDDLLGLYDAEIARARDDARRVSLLDEAAQAAKDFAAAPDRAISYLKELVRLRPDDANQLRNL